MAAIDVVIMAAGKGTRMKSRLPKVLHRLAGRALLAHVVDTVAGLDARRVVIVTGSGSAEVEAAVTGWTKASGRPLPAFVRQEPQLGTGHAIQQAAPALPDDGVTLILNGDVPLVEAATLQLLIDACGGKRLALLTIDMPDPAGYGRIVRTGEAVQAIVEHKDATAQQRELREIYTGFMAAPTAQLKRWLSQLKNDNVQGEYYLTDVVALAVGESTQVVAVKAADQVQVEGVNSPLQLAALERAYQLRRAREFMEAGVRIADPARFDVRGSLQCGQDVEVDVNCVFEGNVSLGDSVTIGPNCFIRNAAIAANVRIQAFTHIDGESDAVTIGEGAIVGPFARLRPGAQLGPDVHIGNFVEVKNSTMGRGSKANHLAYLGDTTVGERVNYGAGAITANYDGANKHGTVIEDDVHIGSNSVLVAPVRIGRGGTVGGGSTITKDTPPGALSVARGKQVSISDWKRPQKAPK
ncbi:UDP-N-acetylglucosamine diphosphorylase/glucosamine-1-phosphate N-acetyltransferase [Caenimonas koreensis DSM 17982]|uniref:Bifunctional protein GlmU n=1 Tax=Caenimonas koreensis DSM 17982 TaxID=1121255 RepID=A0A844ARU1_9BURK|nr:bifunctional UDP-N-acetylglucosamine diphosphorylase/glucosamine-1-phosphate N-acetyltransferase GlmU [Caenimonas koreensis]MRD47120.1 UDP-N-acetylglucosamine diphosphorylase/glucosamine-1-phosphate N-acetyltransferase [Caenimonas koreensis DSM 17982]